MYRRPSQTHASGLIIRLFYNNGCCFGVNLFIMGVTIEARLGYIHQNNALYRIGYNYLGPLFVETVRFDLFLFWS